MTSMRGRPAAATFVLGGIIYFVLLAAALILFHLPPEWVLALTLGGVGFPLICVRPVIGLHLFLITFYLETTITENLPVMKVLGVATLTGWLINVAVTRAGKLDYHPLVVAIGLFVLWCGLTCIFAEDSEAAINRTFQFAQMAVAVMMFSAVLDTGPKIRALYGAIVLWTSIATFVAVVMYYLGMTIVAQGFMHNRNLLAMHINIAIIAAYVLYQSAGSPAVRAILLATFPIFFLGLALTLSRTGLVALMVSLVFLWLRLARERGYFVVGSTLVALCLVCFILPDAFWSRAKSILPAIEKQEDTFGLRVKVWKVGVEMMRDYPIAGVGGGNFLPAFSRYAHGRFLMRHLSPHNAFVGVGAEMGFVGLGLFVLILLLALRTANRAIGYGSMADVAEVRTLAIVAEVGLLALIVASFTGDIENFKLLWIMIGVTLAVHRKGKEAFESRRTAWSLPAGASAPVNAPDWGVAR